ncbi:translation initiation factor eif-2b epsilon subunit-like protein [Coniochaeta sp. 2T2.1]|nr:translation initiation factor eif-2b epsilon subunit-like protein [Coniochaeta sp. 2T2.1]
MSGKQAAKGAAGKGKKAGKGGAAEEKREDVLQAVIIADSFQDRYTPFTLDKPRCLLPLANTPMIEYTLEFLAQNGVQELFIYCGRHIDQVEEYIYDSPRWRPHSKFNPFIKPIEFIRVSDAHSVGDFLRDLDKRGVISSDFVLVHGDLVANLSIDEALAKHRARREANRDAIMTVVLRSAGEDDHRTKAHGITPHFFVDPTTSRCLHYEETHPLQSDHYLTLDPALLDENGALEVRSDLIDCGIDICTPDALALWSESFDYELPRKNFLHGVLKDHELNNKFIYTEILDNGYAARASNLQMYDAISKDILGRWTFPLVPDSNLVMDHTYTTSKDGVCLEEGVAISPGSSITDSVFGQRSKLGSGSTVRNSMIGRRCKIGKNVHIENSYIWDDVAIHDGASVYHSVIADAATVGKGATIPEGTLLSYGVQVGDNIQLTTTQAKISLRTRDGKLANNDSELLGAHGRGGLYTESDDLDSDEEEDEDDPSTLQKSLIYSLAGLNVSSSSVSTLSSSGTDESEIEDAVARLEEADPTTTAPGSATRMRLSSLALSDDSSSGRTGAFHGDAVTGLLDSLRADDTTDFDGAKLEFMGLRLANDASDSAMRRAIAVAFARRAAELLATLSPTKAAENALLSKDGAIKFVREVGVGGGKAEQVELELALQKTLVALVGAKNLEPAKAGVLLAALLLQLYNKDVLEEDGILAWWQDKRAAEGESLAAVREKCRDLVEWLENADEESEEESDDE